MFLDLERDPSVKFLWGHQEKTLDKYFAHHRDALDLAIELPTGTGKTLVGLLIAEYRRRSSNERVAFLCPTRQLCHQVSGQARKYGIPTSLLVGPQQNYDQGQFFSYQQSKTVAITTYSGVFNTNPKINDPQVLICDDAHAAEDYIASLWTLLISRKDHTELFEALLRCLQPHMPSGIAHAVENYTAATPVDRSLVDLISMIALHDSLTTIRSIIEEFVVDTNLAYPWKSLSAHLEACCFYCSPDLLEIRPVIPPTLTHAPFAGCVQRVYMSATLGEDGDIERIFGIKKIARLPAPEGWDKRGTGRRLVLLPGLAASEEEALTTAIDIVRQVKRALVLVPDDRTRQRVADLLTKDFTIFGSADIEQSTKSFVRCTSPAILLIANRYDGIDLPGEDCRLQLVLGLPSGTCQQERYLVSRLSAVSQLRDRVRTRVTQAMGRCTRDESDYSVVILLGDDLLKWVCTSLNVAGMHPELQAEVEFGKENSADRKPSELLQLVQAFLSRAKEWQPAERDIQQRRDRASRRADEGAEMLARACPLEIDYIYSSWSGHYSEALTRAAKVADTLSGDVLKPYRSFWHHLAATSAFLAATSLKEVAFKPTAIAHLEKAAATSLGLNWLPQLIAKVKGEASAPVVQEPVADWFSEINALLEKWGLAGGRFARNLAVAKGNIQATSDPLFQEGLATLGKMLGAKTHTWQAQGAPDGLWALGEWHNLVFEAKTDEQPSAGISLKTVRQASTHLQRAVADKLISKSVPCHVVVISPRQSLEKLAAPHVGNLCYISHTAVIDLFENAAKAIEAVRAIAPNLPEEQLQAKAIEIYRTQKVFLPDIQQLFTQTPLSKLPLV